MTTTPHRIGQIAKAEIEIGSMLELWNSSEPAHRATLIVQAMQVLGWSPPRDPAADQPPLAGPGAPEDGPGRQAFNAARAELAARRGPRA